MKIQLHFIIWVRFLCHVNCWVRCVQIKVYLMFSGDMRRHRWKDSIRSETSFNWENCIEICFITTAFSHVILITFEWHKLGENSQVSGIESEFWCCMSVSFHAIFKPHLAILSLGYLGTARNNNDIVANDLYTVIVVFLLNQLWLVRCYCKS